MIGNNTAAAIIPARGGSQGLPGKNVRMICGKPLIAWTIEKLQRICNEQELARPITERKEAAVID